MPFSVKLPSVAANVLTLHLIDIYTFTHILHEHKFAVPHPSLTKFAEPKHIFAPYQITCTLIGNILLDVS